MKDDDRYLKLFEQLENELSGDHPDEKMSAIARREAEAVIAKYMGIATFFALCAWLPTYLDLPAWMVFVGLAVLAIAGMVIAAERDTRTDRHLVTLHAQDIVRLQITKEVFAAKGECWELKPDVDDDEKLTVYALDDARWDGFWERAYSIALELRRLAPK